MVPILYVIWNRVQKLRKWIFFCVEGLRYVTPLIVYFRFPFPTIIIFFLSNFSRVVFVLYSLDPMDAVRWATALLCILCSFQLNVIIIYMYVLTRIYITSQCIRLIFYPQNNKLYLWVGQIITWIVISFKRW